MPTLQQNVHIINIPPVCANPDETSQKLKKKTEKNKEKEKKKERKERKRNQNTLLALNYIKWTT